MTGNWNEYNRLKAEWVKANPDATAQEYERMVAELATRLKL